MGQFSWIYSDTNRQMLDNVKHDSYLLIPKEFHSDFGAEYFHTNCYDGYGHFVKYDVYEVVAIMNRGFIPELIEYANREEWHCSLSNSDISNLEKFFETGDCDCKLRWLGIIMACYDDDNMRLDYPIKIVENKNLSYEDAGISERDPNQGW